MSNLTKLMAAIAIFGMATTGAMAADLKFEGGATLDQGTAAVVGASLAIQKDAIPFGVGTECGAYVIDESQDKLFNERQYAAQCLVTKSFGKFNLGLGGAYLEHTDEFNAEPFNGAMKVGFDFTDHFSAQAYHWTDGSDWNLKNGRSFVTLSYKF